MVSTTGNWVRGVGEWYFFIILAAVVLSMVGLIYYHAIVEYGIAEGFLMPTAVGVFFVALIIPIAFLFLACLFFTASVVYGSVFVFPIAVVYFVEGLIVGEMSIFGFNPFLVLLLSVVLSGWGYMNYRLGRITFGEKWFWFGLQGGV